MPRCPACSGTVAVGESPCPSCGARLGWPTLAPPADDAAEHHTAADGSQLPSGSSWRDRGSEGAPRSITGVRRTTGEPLEGANVPPAGGANVPPAGEGRPLATASAAPTSTDPGAGETDPAVREPVDAPGASRPPAPTVGDDAIEALVTTDDAAPPAEREQRRGLPRAAKVAGLVVGVALLALAAALVVSTLGGSGDRSLIRAYARGDRGVPLTSSAGKYRAVFPTRPTQRTERATDPVGSFEVHVAESSVGSDVVAQVTWYDLVPGSEPTGAQLAGLLLQNARAEVQARPDGRLTSSKATNVGDLSLLDYTISYEGGSVHRWARTVANGTRVYEVDLVSRHDDRAAFDRLLASFHLSS